MKNLKNQFGIIVFALFLLTANAACAQKNININISKTAQDYINAYIYLRFDELPNFFTSSSTFQDPTLALVSPDAGQTVTGTKAIMEKLNRNFKGIKNPKYVITEAYTVGDFSIIVGVYDYDQNATAFGGPDLLVHFSLKSTTILKEENGKILQHTDYMDYASWFQQFEAQK